MATFGFDDLGIITPFPVDFQELGDNIDFGGFPEAWWVADDPANFDWGLGSLVPTAAIDAVSLDELATAEELDPAIGQLEHFELHPLHPMQTPLLPILNTVNPTAVPEPPVAVAMVSPSDVVPPSRSIASPPASPPPPAEPRTYSRRSGRRYMYSLDLADVSDRKERSRIQRAIRCKKYRDRVKREADINIKKIRDVKNLLERLENMEPGYRGLGDLDIDGIRKIVEDMQSGRVEG